ncbi:winged helix-turn-helix domain-containing protein [Streptomyces sp. NBC_00354]
MASAQGNLAALLLHPGVVVSTTCLLRAVWDEEPHATARAALQTCALRLRRLFTKCGISTTTIEAVPGGYRMHNDTETLDLVLFRALTAQAPAATGPGEELYRLREALSLWHGPPLANVASCMLRRDAAPALEQERLRVLERVCDLELAAGNCHQVLVDLYESARRHPVRERFTEQLIEALYRTGRQAEALAEYRTVRDRLRDELGVDPGAGPRRLELAILRSEEIGQPEPAGARPGLPRAAAPGALQAVPEVPGVPAPSAEPASDSGWRGVPGTRPGRPGLSPVPGFAGRESDRTAIAARLTSAEGPRLVVVSGAPASGSRRWRRRAPAVLPANHAPDFAPDVRTALPAGVRALRAAALACLGSPR